MALNPNDAIGRHRRAVGVFPTRRAAEQALHALRDSGFSMDRVSVIAKDADREGTIAGAEVHDCNRVGNKADEGAKAGVLSGGALGGLTGLLVGLGALAIPGIGPIVLAGAEATVLATALAGGAIGAVAGGLIGALVGLGIPEERAKVYNDRVTRGEYLVLVNGTDAELSRAETILHQGGIEEYGVYDMPDATIAPTAPAAVTPVAAAPVSTTSSRTQYAVGVFRNRNDAEHAIADLRQAGFPLNQVSLTAGQVARREPFAGVELHDRFDAARLGLPAERARFYSDRLAHGDYLVTVHGTDAEINRAAAILNQRGIQDWQLYAPNDSTTVHANRAGVTAPAVAAPARTTATRTTATTNATMPASTVSHSIGHPKRAIGVFAHRRDAEAALTELRDAAFPMDRVSVLAKDADRRERIAGVEMNPRADATTGNKADDGAKAGAATGAAAGGLGGLLVGLGALAIPGIGPVIAGGAAATALATALTGGAIGAAAGGLTGALVGLGIPENQAKVYNDRLNRGDYLVMVDGTEDEVRRAETVLKRRGIQEWGMFDASDVDANHRVSDRVAPRHSTVVEQDRQNPSKVVHKVDGGPDVTIIDRRDQTRR
jgi:hypothetical protein